MKDGKIDAYYLCMNHQGSYLSMQNLLAPAAPGTGTQVGSVQQPVRIQSTCNGLGTHIQINQQKSL